MGLLWPRGARGPDPQAPDLVRATPPWKSWSPARRTASAHFGLCPKNAKRPLPLSSCRTPYALDADPSGSLARVILETLTKRHRFVFQDIRGRYKSEGPVSRCSHPPRQNRSQGIDESTAPTTRSPGSWRTFQATTAAPAWLGILLRRLLTVLATLDPHPALKACRPQSSPADQFSRRRLPPQCAAFLLRLCFELLR